MNWKQARKETTYKLKYHATKTKKYDDKAIFA